MEYKNDFLQDTTCLMVHAFIHQISNGSDHISKQQQQQQRATTIVGSDIIPVHHACDANCFNCDVGPGEWIGEPPLLPRPTAS